MFTDQITLKLVAGKGGDGVVAWRREKYIPKGGPYGGNGGRGGSIFLQTATDLYSLDPYKNRSEIKAAHGKQGGANQRQGRSAKDLFLPVPCGTLIHDAETGELLFDLTNEEETIELCSGGKGGLGNAFFKTPTNQAPNRRTPGKLGQTRTIKLTLKLIADVGFVGMPNAGKSTLLTQMTACQVKIGAYPFTTLTPNISYIEFDDYSRIYLADIPGIIENAHANKGLGHAFLKHIERCNTLVFVIDGSEEDAQENFQMLRNELIAYKSSLADTPYLIALNKTDIIEDLPFSADNLFPISAKTGDGIKEFTTALKTLAQRDGKKYR